MAKLQERIVEFLDGPFKETLEEGFKSFKFRVGDGKWTTYSEADIDEFLDDIKMYINADNLPKWLATGIMTDMGAKNVKGKVTDAMVRVLKNIKSGKIKEITMQPEKDKLKKVTGGAVNKPDLQRLDKKYYK